MRHDSLLILRKILSTHCARPSLPSFSSSSFFIVRTPGMATDLKCCAIYRHTRRWTQTQTHTCHVKHPSQIYVSYRRHEQTYTIFTNAHAHAHAFTSTPTATPTTISTSTHSSARMYAQALTHIHNTKTRALLYVCKCVRRLRQMKTCSPHLHVRKPHKHLNRHKQR